MKSRRGFSLIELALVLGISGLMVGFVLKSQQTSSATDCYAAAKIQLRDVDGAIQRFARQNERLPMPASRSVGVEGTTYGREASGAAIDTAGGTSWGALPFQALGLAPSYASDCWGNKLTYVVTTALTVSAGGYLDYAVLGNITVKKDAATTSTSIAGYAVISHGEDALGAVKNNYAAGSHGWCSGAATLANQNCLASSATIANGIFNNGKDAGAAYFDDLVIAGGRMLSVNGACNNAVDLGCAAGSASNDNGLTACGTTRTWHCDGANGGTDDLTCAKANPVCASCAATSLSWSIGCSAPFPLTAHGGTTAVTANTNPAYTVGSTATATCNNGVFTANSISCTAVPAPINGACNNAVDLGCSAGTTSTDNGLTACGTTRTWHCDGANGGTNATNCSKANAACAACGTASLTWNTNCTATFMGLFHGATTGSVANTNPGYTGSATATCNNGTFTASGTCNALVPVNGACNNSAPGGACASGSASGDNGLVACGTTRAWNCDGANGGSNAACTFANTACAPPAACGPTPYTCTVGTPDACFFHSCRAGGSVGTDNNNWHCISGASNVYCQVDDPPATCFLADARITMADGSSKAIHALKVGDMVRGHTRTNTVIKVPNFSVDQKVYGFNGGEKFVTGGHPFYTAKGWKAIDPTLTPKEGHNVKTTKLTIGDALVLDTGKSFEINSIDAEESTTHEVYSPTVDGDHTYYSNGFLVHNKNVNPCDDIEDFTCGGTPVVNGVCNNAAPLGCTAGTAISDNGQTSCGTTRQWVCQGSGGGSNSGTCSYANAACGPSCGGDEGYCDNGTCYIQCNGVCDTCPNNFGFPIANNFGAGCDGSLCPAPSCGVSGHWKDAQAGGHGCDASSYGSNPSGSEVTLGTACCVQGNGDECSYYRMSNGQYTGADCD